MSGSCLTSDKSIRWEFCKKGCTCLTAAPHTNFEARRKVVPKQSEYIEKGEGTEKLYVSEKKSGFIFGTMEGG